MIFFLDKSLAPKIVYKRPKEYVNKTIWIFASISEFYSYKNFFNDFNFFNDLNYCLSINKMC